jgi:hypothetical protein
MEGVEMTGGGTHSVDTVDAPTASTLAGRPSRAPDYQGARVIAERFTISRSAVSEHLDR